MTAVALYVVQLADPVDRLISWLDEIQVGATLVRAPRRHRARAARPHATDDEPDGDRLRAEDVRYAYVAGRDVLHGIDLDLEPGERVAVVGPSGRGQVDARAAARGHPPAAAWAASRSAACGSSTCRSTTLRTRGRARHAGAARLRRHARREPAPRPAGRLRRAAAAALDAVDALEWADALPDGLETVVGAGGYPLTPAQAQQVALARLVLADPHTLVLDEATSLLDPRAARHLERSLASVLDGRTVVAIAHRLHTAHDADRVAVVEDGLLHELGTHDELVARGGSYAALWDSWHGDRSRATLWALKASRTLQQTVAKSGGVGS